MIHVTQVRYAGEHRLALTFSDGTLGVADLTSELDFKPFAPLRDRAVFAKAFVEDGTVCWPGGLDLAPERLYALAHELTPPETLEQAHANEAEVSLRELRKALGINQHELADAMGMSQPDVSKLERRSDHLISTVRRAVRAFGGDIEITAVVGSKRVKLAM